MPSDAVGGGQYAAIMANLEQSKDQSGGFAAEARIALLLHSTIDGDVTYSGCLVNHGITGFTLNSAIRTTSTLENTGNSDYEAVYRMVVEPFFGGESVYEDKQEKVIFPETTRVFEQVWGEAPSLGMFNVTQEISYLNEAGEQVTDTFRSLAVICPLWLILVVFAIVVLCFVAVVLQVRARQKRSGGKGRGRGARKPSWEQG